MSVGSDTVVTKPNPLGHCDRFDRWEWPAIVVTVRDLKQRSKCERNLSLVLVLSVILHYYFFRPERPNELETSWISLMDDDEGGGDDDGGGGDGGGDTALFEK